MSDSLHALALTVIGPDQLNAFHLSSAADCMSPDAKDSAGANFLRRVRDAILELLDEADDDVDLTDLHQALDYNGEVSDRVDGAVPIYTRDVWAAFADLGAYQEDPSELGYTDTSDMEQLAKVCLYFIGERLAGSLLLMVQDEAAAREEEIGEEVHTFQPGSGPLPDSDPDACDECGEAEDHPNHFVPDPSL